MADAWGASWGGTFIVWGAVEQITAKSYGAPFVDFRLDLSPNLDFLSKMRLDIAARMPSSRIDINGESEP